MYTVGCQTSCTTRFVNPLNEQWLQTVAVHSTRLSNQLSNPFDNWFHNRLYRVYKHSTGCQHNRLNVCKHDTAGCQTAQTSIQTFNRLSNRLFVYTIQPVVKPVVQPVVSCKRGFTMTQSPEHTDGSIISGSAMCAPSNTWFPEPT